MLMPRLTLCLICLVALAAGCGEADGGLGQVGGGPEASAQNEPAESMLTEEVPRYEGNPGDILTLSNLGVSESILHYETYDQMRDYSDAVVLARFDRLEPTAEPSTDGSLSGFSLVYFDVVEVIGGREQPRTSEGQVVLTLPLDGEPKVRASVLQRLSKLEGEATYLLFLRRSTPHPGIDVFTYVPNLENGPSGLLAVWPGDGRLSPVAPLNDLAAPAIERGEELTGTSLVNEIDVGPKFIGEKPIGFTVGQLREEFARPVGTVSANPPDNWDEYLRVATAAGAYS